MRREGAALEIVLASALLVAVAAPIYGLLQSSAHVAHLDEFQVLARRRARQAMALLSGHPVSTLLAASTDGAPPPGMKDPRLSPEAREIPLPMPSTGIDLTLENLPPKAQRYYLGRVGKVPVRAFIEDLEPGLARLAVLVTWVDPASRTGRHLVVTRLVEDPFPWSGGKP